MKLKLFVLLAALSALGCDDTQYVNPDTVALIITRDDGVERLNRCHYIPVLLGSRIEARYPVDGALRATLTLTRDEVSVQFEDAGRPVSAFTLPSQQFADEGRVAVESPPAGFSVQLASPCTPPDF